MRGKFVVFEGIDGSSKGTQLKLSANYLFDLNKEYDVYITREPTRDYKEIRNRMSRAKRTSEDAQYYATAFFEDRANHVKKYIEPCLNNGTHVLCDRYKHSTLAYQHAQGIDLQEYS